MNLHDAYYEHKFENAYILAKGDEFQTFFERLMALAYKTDFMACRPWGGQGDRKNDGFLRSERCLFQVYAPNEMTARKAIIKISADFEGAKDYWQRHFDKWVFVHNAIEGLPPHIQEFLLDCERNSLGVKLETWGLEELREVFRKLTIEDKISWFGVAPTNETMNQLGFKELRVVLERIATLPAPVEIEVRDVPEGKIEANALSESVAHLLKVGMIKSSLVSDFFSQWHDDTYGERLAEAFRVKYRQLREKNTPNQIFAKLQAWAGGDNRGLPEYESAILTVLAYFFELCDIFEEPRSDAR